MIKRLFKIARAEFNDLLEKNKSDKRDASSADPDFFDVHQEEASSYSVVDPLEKYYANLEIPVGSDRATIKSAWKTQMKKYHPDLHCSDPTKKQIAEDLARQLTEAYRTLDAVFLNK